MEILILESEIKKRVRLDDELKLVLAKANSVKVDTVNKWLREDDDILTTATNLAIIRKHFDIPGDEPLTESKDVIPEGVKSN